MGVLAVDWGRESVRASEYPAISSTVQRVAYFPVAPNSSYYYTYTVVHVYPHDPDAFTQGLVFEDDRLFEGTGLYGQSSLREVDLESGAVLRSLSLPPQYFGEGITIHDNRIVQLTWRSNIGFVYDRDSFELLEDFEYPTEGWGITHDGRQLIVSDGTATLYFWDPATLSEVGRIEVRDQYGPVNRLNELEYVRGEVFANVWYTDLIARIDPHTGQVLGWINLEGLLDSGGGERAADVLNGIAYDAENDRLFVTGKLWPWLFEIELVPAK
ncbi:MAG: glutaminyl-peptide cyclotransferase [Anaerolineae bacterium]|nr:glutaminyl-peptide cyclotransferase [Anaerolineae bacterium]